VSCNKIFIATAAKNQSLALKASNDDRGNIPHKAAQAYFVLHIKEKKVERTVDKSNLTITIEAQIPLQLDTERLMSDIKALLNDRAVKARLRSDNTDMLAFAKAVLPEFKQHLHHYSALSNLPADYDEIEKIAPEDLLYAAESVGVKLFDGLEFNADRIAKQTFEMFVSARIEGMFNEEIAKFLQYLGQQNWIQNSDQPCSFNNW